jgi:lipoprotein signal peptidase
MLDQLASRFGSLLFCGLCSVRCGRQRTSDRIRLGSARGFLFTPWAIINFADVAVAVGLLGMVIALSRFGRCACERSNSSERVLRPALAGRPQRLL